jgi:hypothetical protein
LIYVIHPKFILSEPFVNVFIKFLYDRSHSSAVHDRMGAVRKDLLKPFKKDDKGTAIELSNFSIDIPYVIHPKYVLSEPSCSCFIKFLYDQSRSSAYTVMQD